MDGGPSRTNKSAFSNFSGLVRTGPRFGVVRTAPRCKPFHKCGSYVCFPRVHLLLGDIEVPRARFVYDKEFLRLISKTKQNLDLLHIYEFFVRFCSVSAMNLTSSKAMTI